MCFPLWMATAFKSCIRPNLKEQHLNQISGSCKNGKYNPELLDFSKMLSGLYAV